MKSLPRSPAELFQSACAALALFATAGTDASLVVDSFVTGVVVPQESPASGWGVSQSGAGILGVRSVDYQRSAFNGDAGARFEHWAGAQRIELWSIAASDGSTAGTWVGIHYSGFGQINLGSPGLALQIDVTGAVAKFGNAGASLSVTVRGGNTVRTALLWSSDGQGASLSPMEVALSSLIGPGNLASVDSIEVTLQGSAASMQIHQPPILDPELPGAGGALWEGAALSGGFTFSGISIVPAPAAAPALLVLGALVRSRRRA